MEDISSKQEGVRMEKRSIADIFKKEHGVFIEMIDWNDFQKDGKLRDAFQSLPLYQVTPDEVYHFVESHIQKAKKENMNYFDEQIFKWRQDGKKIADITPFDSRDHKVDLEDYLAKKCLNTIMGWYKSNVL